MSGVWNFRPAKTYRDGIYKHLLEKGIRVHAKRRDPRIWSTSVNRGMYVRSIIVDDAKETVEFHDDAEHVTKRPSKQMDMSDPRLIKEIEDWLR